MHTREDEARSRPIGVKPKTLAIAVPVLVFAAILGSIGWSLWPIVRPARGVEVVQAVFDRSLSASPEQEGAPKARAVPTVQAPGWLEPEPFGIACAALVDGVVESIEVLEGDPVSKGQVVARLIAEDSELRLLRAEAGLADAQASLAVARAELEAAERTWAEPVELDRKLSSSRSALAESEAELAQLPLLIASAQATLKRTEIEADRVRQSADQNAANEFEAIVAEQHAAAQRAATEAIQARRPILEARIARLRSEVLAAERHLSLRIEDGRQLGVARARLGVAEAVLSRATVARDEAALELERMVIRAPITGYVQRRIKSPGDKVVRMMDDPHSSHLMLLYDPERLQVRVDVPLADAAHISVGQACEVVVEVLPDRTFRGEVLRTTHEADLQKNTLQVKVKVFDPDQILRPEMLTRVKFLAPEGARLLGDTSQSLSTHRVLVPAGALADETSEIARVWIVTQRRNGRGVLASRQVRIVARDGAWVTVDGGILPGDLIAVGLDSPSEGERVEIDGNAKGDPS